MMTYLLQVSVCWIVFYAIYILFLRKETFFAINRYYLIGALITGLLIPFLGTYLPANQTSTEIYQVMHQITAVEVTPEIEHSRPLITWNLAILLVYYLGFALVFSRFLYGLYRIFSIYKGSLKTRYKNYTLVESTQYHLPFSFFKYIFISKEIPLQGDVEKVLRHEELHANQWHSLDIIMTELLQAFFWFNPILIFYKNALRQSHEFLADAYVTKEHNRNSYGQLLLRQSTSGLEVALANHFFHSQIKNRITMMYKEKSKRPAMVKYLAAVPVLIGLVVLFASNAPSTSTPENPPMAELIYQDQGDPIFKFVEEMPRFPGCETDYTERVAKEKCAKEKLFQFMSKNVTYPQIAKDNKVEGTCVVQFVIEADGKISNTVVVRDIGAGCGQAALSMINAMPDWIPGKQKGKKVRVQYNIPVTFKLPEEEEEIQEIETIHVTAIGKPIHSETEEAEEVEEVEEAEVIDVRSIKRSAYDLKKELADGKPVHASNINKKDLFKVVEEMPRFPGCEDIDDQKAKEDCAKKKMLEFIYTNLRYPKEAREKGVSGMAVVQLIVERDGSISHASIIKNPGAGTGKEVQRVVESMPKWIPGKQSGKTVRVVYTLPVKFKLQDDSPKGKKPIAATNIAKEVDQLPLFPGTDTKEESTNGLLNFVFKNVKYPKDAAQNNIEGIALIKFMIGTNGEIGKIKLVKSPGWGIDEEVLKLMDEMKEIGEPWTPAKVGDKSVAYEYVLPVKFKLQDDELKKAESRRLQVEDLSIQPNPNQGIFNLSFSMADKSPTDIIFYNLSGQVLKTMKGIGLPYNNSIDLSEFGGQTIFMNIIQNDKVYSEKIIIQ